MRHLGHGLSERLRCPYCGKREVFVLYTRRRVSAAEIRRRYQCIACERRFNTWESQVDERQPEPHVHSCACGWTAHELNALLLEAERP